MRVFYRSVIKIKMKSLLLKTLESLILFVALPFLVSFGTIKLFSNYEYWGFSEYKAGIHTGVITFISIMTSKVCAYLDRKNRVINTERSHSALDN